MGRMHLRSLENKAGSRGDWDLWDAHGSCPKAGGRRAGLRALLRLETATL